MYTRQKNIRDALTDTCKWLFSTPEYYNWAHRYNNNASELHGLLWIKGKPGAGKSTLMKEALHRTEESFFGTETTVAGFFFNSRSAERLEKTPLGLFRSILHQVLQQSQAAVSSILPDYLQEKETRCLNGSVFEWHQADLQKYLRCICTAPGSNPVFIFIDALDECDEREVRDLVDYFRDLTVKASFEGAQLRVCLSSRHYPSISVDNCAELVIEHHNEPDILQYIRTEAKYVNTVSSLQDKIFQKSQGVFLWVVLVVSMLKSSSYGKSLKWMENKLEEIPPELHSLFRDLFQELNPEESDTQKAICFIQWILFATEAIKVSELHFLLGFSGQHAYRSIESWGKSDEFLVPEKQLEMITALSRGLVEPVVGSGKDPFLQFIHESVRDFFLTGSGFELLDPGFGGQIEGKGHSAIALTCVNFLRAQQESKERHYNSKRLLRYTAINLFTHVEKAEKKSVDQREILSRLLLNWSAVFESISTIFGVAATFRVDDQFEKDESFLYYCSRKKLSSCVSRLLEFGEDVNERSPTLYQYPLLAAASKAGASYQWPSWLKTLRAILDAGADVNLRNRQGNTALHVAAEGRNTQVVELLLKAGAAVNAEDKWKQTPLHIAAWQSTTDIIAILLDAGADTNAVDSSKMTPIEYSTPRPNYDKIKLVFRTKRDKESLATEDSNDRQRTFKYYMEKQLPPKPE